MDFEFLAINSASDLATGLVVGIIALALGLRKLHSMYASDGVSIARVNSELDVITLLREQIQDLARANKELREEIEQLRRLNVTLISENDDLKHEVRLLRVKNTELVVDIQNLNITVDTLRDQIQSLINTLPPV